MIVVLGAGGQVGTAILAAAPGATAVVRERFDLASVDSSDVEDLIEEFDPTVIVNCAAYTAVDQAEAEEDLATRINGEAVGLLATACARRRITFVTYSTDYVFDGTNPAGYREDDATNPANAYGRSKLAGEQAALAAGGGVLVIRTSWVISGTHNNFVATMLRLTGEGRSLNVVDDQRGRPTIAADLAVATLQAVEAGVSGILHLANQGETTWYQLARTAVTIAGGAPDLIAPCATADYPTPARRPACSVLHTDRAESLRLAPLPPWQESLPGVVSAILSRQ